MFWPGEYPFALKNKARELRPGRADCRQPAIRPRRNDLVLGGGTRIDVGLTLNFNCVSPCGELDEGPHERPVGPIR